METCSPRNKATRSKDRYCIRSEIQYSLISLSLSLSKVRILFEESFYNSRDESYQVFCLDQPLEGALTDDAGAVVKMDTLEDCNNYLWKDPGQQLPLPLPLTFLLSPSPCSHSLLPYPVNDKVKRSVDNLLDFFQMEQGGSLRASMVSVTLLTHQQQRVCVMDQQN